MTMMMMIMALISAPLWADCSITYENAVTCKKTKGETCLNLHRSGLQLWH